MTTQAIPDPISLKSWEEAFQYPLPTVRKLSIRLRKDIDDHRSRLRSLVGASYRDLLGTAERIIDMDTQIQTVESDLSDIGRRCNSRILERGDANYARLEHSWGEQSGKEEKLGSAARSRILSAALAMVDRLVKKRGDALQAAKLMVLSRLLYKSLEGEASEQLSLERQRRRISSLRSRLLAYLDRTLFQSTLDADEVTNTLSAFALLSSSKLRDVLGHFLAVRIARLEILSASPTPEVMLEVLSLYTDTIRLVQTIFPKRISESLSNLGKVALLSDKHITQATELNLDIYGRWVTDEIKSFRPWVQQDGFPGNEARKDLTAFSTGSRAVLLSALEQCLKSSDDAGEVLRTRKQVLGAYLNMGTQMKIDGFLDHVQEMRAAFVRHLAELAGRAAALDNFSLGRGVSSPRAAVSPATSIWSLADTSFDLSSGGINLRKSVLRLRHGVDKDLDAVVAPLQAWHHGIQAFSQVLNTMRSTRWEEHFDTDVEEGEEEIGKVFQGKLSVDDSNTVEKSLQEGVSAALERAAATLEAAVQDGSEARRPDFLIRVDRELKKRQSLTCSLVNLPASPVALHSDLARKLHESLAVAVLQKSLAVFEQSMQTKQYIAADLWDGTPKLPLLPLPAVFRFVMALQKDMSAYNEDVWSSSAVDALKIEASNQLTPILLHEPQADSKAKQTRPTDDAEQQHDEPEVVNEISAGEDNKQIQDEASELQEQSDDTQAVETNGVHSKMQEEEGQSLVQARGHEQRVQRLYDALYLDCIVSIGKQGLPKDLIMELKTQAALEKSDLQRLEKHVNEYWRRTYLLFGLLAAASESVTAKR